jgi:hypothetical protein
MVQQQPAVVHPHETLRYPPHEHHLTHSFNHNAPFMRENEPQPIHHQVPIEPTAQGIVDSIQAGKDDKESGSEYSESDADSNSGAGSDDSTERKSKKRDNAQNEKKKESKHAFRTLGIY